MKLFERKVDPKGKALFEHLTSEQCLEDRTFCSKLKVMCLKCGLLQNKSEPHKETSQRVAGVSSDLNSWLEVILKMFMSHTIMHGNRSHKSPYLYHSNTMLAFIPCVHIVSLLQTFRESCSHCKGKSRS